MTKQHEQLSTRNKEKARREAVGRWKAAQGDHRKYGSVESWAPEDDPDAIVPFEDGYPPGLLDLDTPGVLFVRGELPVADRPALAVVGSRAVDAEGVRLTKKLVRELSQAGLTIVSGGAIGVDWWAHRTALDAGGSTVAFLPSSLSAPSPARNRDLFAEIAQRGALCSEYPEGVKVRRYHFHRRNRLIAAFSDAVLVVRAKEKSGTMLTARAALDLGRPLLVLPGSPEDETAMGCIRLIQQNATCVANAADILDALGLRERSTSGTSMDRPLVGVSDEARKILALMDTEMHVDEVIRTGGVDAGKAAALLLELQLAGAARKLPGGNVWKRT